MSASEQQTTGSRLSLRLHALIVCGALVGISTTLNEFVLPPILQSLSVPVTPSSFSPDSLTVSLLVGSGLTVLVAVVFLSISERGLGYLDADIPTLRGCGYIVGGVLLNLGASLGVSLITSIFGLPPGGNSTVSRVLAGGTATAIVFIVLVVLLVGPAEELLYRNIIQKRLSEDFSTSVALFLAGALFALSHVPNVYDPNATAMISPLLSNWAAGIIYGGIYIRTRSIVPAMLAHGFYNAVVVGLVVLGVVSA